MISAPGMSTSTTLRTFDEINKAYVDSVIQDVNKYGKAGKDAVIAMYKKLGMDKLLGGPSNGSTYLEMFEHDEYGGLTQDFQLLLPDRWCYPSDHFFWYKENQRYLYPD
jgi:hypothetical protein